MIALEMVARFFTIRNTVTAKMTRRGLPHQHHGRVSDDDHIREVNPPIPPMVISPPVMINPPMVINPPVIPAMINPPVIKPAMISPPMINPAMIKPPMVNPMIIKPPMPMMMAKGLRANGAARTLG